MMSQISELEITDLSIIGLDKKKSKELSKKLNILLANYSIFYQNVRGYHWNLKGEKFFELHVNFEELYGDLYLKIDEIAERILTIGFAADHNYSTYKTTAKIAESGITNNASLAAEDVLNSLKIIVSLQRDILAFTNSIGDQGTQLMMINAIKSQEKMIWMYSSYLQR